VPASERLRELRRQHPRWASVSGTAARTCTRTRPRSASRSLW
jgi:hypothetical protein